MDEGTNQVIAADSDENTEQLRADIEDTRAEMTQTINEIQERLSPEHLVGQVKETVREATIGKVEKVMERVGETISGVTEPAREVAGRAGSAIKEAGSSVADSVWKNPIPVALIGLGVGMLLMRNFRGQRYTSTRPGPSQGRVPNYAMGNTGQMRQTQGSAGTLQNAASDLATKAKNTASTVGTRFEQVLHDNPLAIGAVAVAAGTAVGLVLPTTRFESEYIGETGERLVDRVEDVARGALDKVQDAARQMAPEAQQQPPA
jgi:ElaB/YqjD/DUF883 family membrane-anchored ribosome-binding protein